MWWLSDRPDPPFGDLDLKPASWNSLPPGAQAAWRTLATDQTSTPFVAAIPSPDPHRVVVQIHRATRSSYDSIRRALSRGVNLPDSLVCLTTEGTGLRGHRNRSWEALPGNLHLSFLIRDRLPILRAGAGLSILPAIVAAEWLAARLPDSVDFGIKWVNDLTVDNRKIGGVLASSSIRSHHFEDCLFGIGLNLSSSPDIEPDIFVPGTACLGEWSHPPNVVGSALEIIDALQLQFQSLLSEGNDDAMDCYRRRSIALGREVLIYEDVMEGNPTDCQPLAGGVLQHIDSDLGLRISGCPSPVHRGRLAFAEDVPVRKNDG